MTLRDSGNDRKSSSDLRTIGLLTAVPGLLLAAPLIGGGIGWWLDSKFGTEPWLLVIGVLMGLASGGIETYYLVKKASGSEEDSRREG